MYGLLTKCEVKMAGYWSSSFFAFFCIKSVKYPWQRHDGYHYVSLVMYITGAKFEEHYFNISGVILD